MKRILILSVLLMAVVFTGCGQKAVTVDNKVIGPRDQPSIEKSIILAARSLGWQVQPVDDQTMEATIHSNDATLTVLITYTSNSYVIQHEKSVGLDFNPTDNSIKKQYARWVEDLDDRIQDELERAERNAK